ncbi:MAG: sigma-70 family RNA polymerase sigma factor [Nitriliruptor sp.]
MGARASELSADAARSDEELLARYADAATPRGARETAFSTLVDRFHRRVFAVCLRTLNGDVSDAEDATQEVFVRLARSADTFRGDAKLSTWLYAVARNVSTDRIRHEARRPSTPVADVSDVAAVGARSAVAEDRHGEAETANDLAAALAQLDEISRTLLLLVAVEGLSYAEAAAASDLAVGTVKSRVSRARVRLGELLATDDAAGVAGERADGDASPATEGRRTGHAPRGPPPSS